MRRGVKTNLAWMSDTEAVLFKYRVYEGAGAALAFRACHVYYVEAIKIVHLIVHELYSICNHLLTGFTVCPISESRCRMISEPLVRWPVARFSASLACPLCNEFKHRTALLRHFSVG